jgi:glycosyltransferase involved in cell wall biosynthesis
MHDGPPNSLLEAMAVGCLPVCGHIESIREWITDGENGLLVDPADSSALAAAVLRGIEDEGLRRMAANRNLEIILARAEVSRCAAR